MGVFDTLSRLLRGNSSDATEIHSDCDQIPSDHLVSRARGETVTADVLANRSNRSDAPIIEYLTDDEQPHHVFLGNQIVISNDDSSTTRYPTRHTQVVITNSRLLVMLGGRVSDTIWEVPLENVLDVYIDDESWRQYLVVDADREDQRMTFFVDVTIESHADELQSSIEYVRDYAP